jgi:hypothetical protein
MINLGLGNVRIKGISGKMYTFRAYPLETSFAEFGAVYFITGRRPTSDGRTAHSRIYCGESGNMSVCPYNSRLSASFKANYANCICILPVQEDASRRDIERDIHQNYKLLTNS